MLQRKHLQSFAESYAHVGGTEKDIIFEGFSHFLNKMNIGDESLHYIEGLVRGLIKDDKEKYDLARKAYVSMLRAYFCINLGMPE